MKKNFLGIVCLLYAIIIIYVTLNGSIKNFLAPQMQENLYMTIVPLIIMGLVLCLNDKINYKFKITDLVLLLPLIMLLLATDGRLSTNIASNRMDNFTSKNSKQEKTKTTENIIESNSNYDFSKVDFDVIDETYDTLARLITYEDKADILEGKTIRVRGFAQKKADYIPDKYFVLGKYGVSCCLADASFLGFFADYNKKKIKNNQWYEIEGILEKGKDVAGYTIMVVKVINIKEINSKKEDEYVYACYSYGDGKCSELDKYMEYIK